MGAEQEEADSFAALAFDEVGEAAGAFGAAHFAADARPPAPPIRVRRPPICRRTAQKAVVGPVGDHRLVVAAFALGDFVFVVREDEVEAAAVDVERFAEQLLAHRGAFDVPAGSAVAPRAVPRRLAGLGCFPQCEVGGVAFPLAAAPPSPCIDSIERFESLP